MDKPVFVVCAGIGFVDHLLKIFVLVCACVAVCICCLFRVCERYNVCCFVRVLVQNEGVVKV